MKEIKIPYNGINVFVKAEYINSEKTKIKIKTRINGMKENQIKISSLKSNGIDILLKSDKESTISNFSLSFIININDIKDNENYKFNVNNRTKGGSNVKGRIIVSKDLYRKENEND